ncbi:MAG TPA: FAD-dependent oxidoreductase, partial [Armatimonadota bacterium]|nr:FAD-dependent oxidoreductase [Armatimonadota bacterium]
MSLDTYDVLVLGTGAAGCSAALRAADLGARVLLVTKGSGIMESNTAQAQGGIIARGHNDSPELLEEDIFNAGDGLCWPPAVKQLAEQGPPLVYSLLIDRLDVGFTRHDGDLVYTKEAAHSTRRILYAADATGRAIAEGLAKGVREHPNIEIWRHHSAVDLITLPHHSTDPLDIYEPIVCLGAYLLNQKTGEVHRVLARKTVLATGGPGQVYLHTTNPRGARGDGLAMVSRARGEIINAEYIQFHPTAFYHRDADRFLISESVRGEGGKLRNRQGEHFMEHYHPLGDLAPRDVVARAIWEEMLKDGSEYVLLDLSDIKVDVTERFPTIYQTLLQYGIDITKQPIPVVPAAHYFMGGVKVDLVGRSSIQNLYAVGELSCTGLHGANRLASTSLLEALTWGYKAGEDAINSAKKDKEPRFSHVADWQDTGLTETIDPALIVQDWMTIRTTMWNYAGIVRSSKRLARAIADLSYLAHRIEQFYRETKLTDQLVG